MEVYFGESLEKYINENLNIDSAWNRRYFTQGVEDYLKSSTEKVLVVSGLKGTGKTVGLLQIAQNFDTCYVLTSNNERETGKEYIDLLENIDNKCVVFDEYGWIKDRDCLDRYLLSAVQKGKRIAITGTESINLNYLNNGKLLHRVKTLHTTMFTYDEYCHLYNMKHSKETCLQFLREGGLFSDYILRNYECTKAYIEEAIVKNLANYLQGEMTEEEARTLTYSVLYKAICPSNLSSVPTLDKSSVTMNSFFEAMNINDMLEIDENKLRRVAVIFEDAGLIVRVKNFVPNSDIKEQYYITNPSLTSQLIMKAYGLSDLDNYIYGHIFESCVMVQLSNYKLTEQDIYFYNNNGTSSVNKELDIILTDNKKEYAYFFECKFAKSDKIDRDITLLSGHLENGPFQNTDIEGRYVVYNGKPCVRDYDVGRVIFTPLDRILNRYYEFNKNAERILEQENTYEDRRSGRNNDINDNNISPNTTMDRKQKIKERIKEVGKRLPQILANRVEEINNAIMYKLQVLNRDKLR